MLSFSNNDNFQGLQLSIPQHRCETSRLLLLAGSLHHQGWSSLPKEVCIFPFTFGKYLNKTSNCFSLMAMQNYEFDSVSLSSFCMIFNKIIYCKDQAKEEKQTVEHLLPYTSRGRKAGVGGTLTGLLMSMSQRYRKCNIFQGAFCLWWWPCNCVRSENHFRDTVWKSALTFQQQRSTLLLLLQLV